MKTCMTNGIVRQGAFCNDCNNCDDFQWQYKLMCKSKVVESALFGVTASGFWISAGTPFVPISLALPADKREYGDANYYLAFTRYDGIIPSADRSTLVTGQIFHQ